MNALSFAPNPDSNNVTEMIDCQSMIFAGEDHAQKFVVAVVASVLYLPAHVTDAVVSVVVVSLIVEVPSTVVPAFGAA